MMNDFHPATAGSNRLPRNGVFLQRRWASSTHPHLPMLKNILLIVFSVSSILSGCAGIDPKGLSAPDSAWMWSLSLEEDMAYKGKRGLYPFEEGLRKGIYKAEYQDATGVYLRGPEKCAFTTPGHDNVMRIYEGGVWIPKNRDLSKARIYSYFSAGDFYAQNPKVREQKGFLLHAPILQDDGKIIFWPAIEDVDFLSKLQQRLVNQ
jgi:hypothetical protein